MTERLELDLIDTNSEHCIFFPKTIKERSRLDEINMKTWPITAALSTIPLIDGFVVNNSTNSQALGIGMAAFAIMGARDMIEKRKSNSQIVKEVIFDSLTEANSGISKSK